MIRYALACSKGHAFESWFRDSASYDEQVARGLVSCPHCGATKVEKQIMAPAVARTDREIAPAPAEAPPPAPVEAPAVPAPFALMGEREQAFRALLRAVKEHVKSTAEHVGPRFADEARKMHEGLTEFRAIYGEATPEEATALAEEGIDAVAIPWLPDDQH
ncbi:DUF1178 family protein [uncultured Alsobacter sp.]|uniref:DUF1178 family protein n=1 Tax=uncultured Alsobacter sp. TaxID=1748258 RepID=UPI0025E1A11F|nr:DUF1178 family protein [uncultured Alsobacter sp.]